MVFINMNKREKTCDKAPGKILWWLLERHVSSSYTEAIKDVHLVVSSLR